jgi:hypothetical protein
MNWGNLQQDFMKPTQNVLGMKDCNQANEKIVGGNKAKEKQCQSYI